MFRIHCDANERDGLGRYILAIQDIAPIADKLTAGMHVILYEPEDYEVEAVLDFDDKHKVWVALAIWSTIKYL